MAAVTLDSMDARGGGTAAARELPRRLPLHWRLRNRLAPERRADVRRAVDRLAATAFGSVNGGRSDDVAITLDDGPDDEVTPRVLEILDRWQASATFFVLAGRAADRPAITRAIVDAGHEVGLHGVDHRRLPSFEALVEGRVMLEGIVESPVRWFRPPFGALDVPTYRAVRRAGMDVVVWSAEGADWIDDPVAAVAERAVAAVQPGGVLLLHERIEPGAFDEDAPRTTFDRAELVDRVLAGLAAQGMSGRSVTEIVQDGARRTAWFRP